METILKGLGRLGTALLSIMYSMVFLYWRHQTIWPQIPSPFSPQSFLGLGKYALNITFFIIFGIFIYYFYRGVFHRFVWWFQRRWYPGIPQYQFHQAVCEDLKINGQVKEEIGISQACLFLTQIQESERYQSVTEDFNKGSHFLYLSSFMFALSLLHDVVWTLVLGPSRFSPLWSVLFFVLTIVSFWVALAYDRLADFREVTFLAQHRKEYEEIVKNLYNYWEARL